MKLWEPKWKCLKAVPRPLRCHVVWSRTLDCSVNLWSHMWPCPQSHVISMNLYSCRSSTIIKYNKSIVVIIRNAMVSRFCVRPTSKWPWNMIHRMPCRNPCRHYMHLAITYSVGPSSVVWSELGPGPLFPPMRVPDL